MVTKDIHINHDILLWARKQANLSPERAALKARISEIKKRGLSEPLTPSLRLERWEQGKGSPTYAQLVKLAKASSWRWFHTPSDGIKLLAIFGVSIQLVLLFIPLIRLVYVIDSK